MSLDSTVLKALLKTFLNSFAGTTSSDLHGTCINEDMEMPLRDDVYQDPKLAEHMRSTVIHFHRWSQLKMDVITGHCQVQANENRS
jgi:hypothetical protein